MPTSMRCMLMGPAWFRSPRTISGSSSLPGAHLPSRYGGCSHPECPCSSTLTRGSSIHVSECFDMTVKGERNYVFYHIVSFEWHQLAAGCRGECHRRPDDALGLSLVFARIDTMCQITKDTRYNSASPVAKGYEARHGGKTCPLPRAQKLAS